MSIGIFVGAILIGIAALYTIHAILTSHYDTSTITQPAPHDSIPLTAIEQNKEGDATFTDALTAINKSDVIEAKKLLDRALVLYKAANNENGIANVNAQYLIIDKVPKKPSHPNIVTN